MSASTSNRRLASPAVKALIRRRAGEFGALLLALLAIALLVALITHDQRDPSLNTATTRVPHNLAGPFGAAVSDILLQGFGLAGALPALALLGWAWRLASHRPFGAVWLRLIALALGVPALAAALAALPVDIAFPTRAGLGGITGATISPGLQDTIGGTFGLLGRLVVAALTWVVAGTLSIMAMGLTAGEWKTAGQHMAGVAAASAMVSAQGGKHVGGAVLRSGGWLLRLFRRKPAAAQTPAVLPRRDWQADDEETAPASPPPRVQVPPQPRAAARKRPPPRQEVLPLADGTWQLPSLSLLTPAPARTATGPSEDALQANAQLLENVLGDYGVQGRIVEIRPGPVVTLYELEPAPGIRSSRVIGLADDVARSLSVTAVRIATVPGRNVIGIEVPNAKRETVYLSEMIGLQDVMRHSGKLAVALGKDIGGEPVFADLSRMPHLLVAGTTGSGKSVGINAMILSLLYRLSPDQCRLILIDPKMLELSVYEGIPHLMAPVVTEPAKAVTALKWTVKEMERRYRAMSQLSVRNIGGYNDRVAEARAKGEVVTRRVQTGFDPETGRPVFEDQPLSLETLPFIVLVIDEVADLMMVAGKEIEAAVQRLAQMARAAGIHVVMATQRPSVDVITGTIKANFPTRISFQVISKFDSRTILGEQGAEQLLGMGDMLYMAGGGRLLRVHGPFVADKDVEQVVAYLRTLGEPVYEDAVTTADEEEAGGLGFSGIAGASEADKALFDQAVALVAREGKASTSFIQRHLSIGYNRAAKLIELMEKEGIVGPANHVGKREVLVRREHDDY